MFTWIRTHSIITLLLSGLAMALIGMADYVTGQAFSYAAFYLLLVGPITWMLGRAAGLGIALASAATSAWVDIAAGRTVAHALWELATNGMIFGVMSFVFGELQQALEQAQRMAEHDLLTGLANRGRFYQQVASELIRCRRYRHPFTIAFIDCDNFKAINDRLGHQIGDALLCAVANVLRLSVRSSDIVARLGGDEFIIGFVETGIDTALSTVERMRQSLNAAMLQQGWPVTFSIGIATFTSPPASVDTLVQRADELMYAAKQSGKDAIPHAVVESDVLVAGVAPAGRQ